VASDTARLNKPTAEAQDWAMTKKLTKNELLTELDLRIESVSPDMAPDESGNATSDTTADIKERDAKLTRWRDEVKAASDGDPILDEISAQLD
jgi:hypothetical protein